MSLRSLVVAAFMMVLLGAPAGAGAAGWSPAQRIATSAPFEALGVPNVGATTAPLPDGRFGALSVSGVAVGAVGADFPAPAALPSTPTAGFPVRAVFRADGSATVAYEQGTALHLYDRAADGSYGAQLNPLSPSSSSFDLAADPLGGEIAVYGTNSSQGTLHVLTRAPGDATFANASIATGGSIDWPRLVVDPSGAVVAIWTDESGSIRQAVRPAGAGRTAFGAATAVQTGGIATASAPNGFPMPVVGQNAAGRAVAVFFDSTRHVWRAAIREPGAGSGFGAPADLGAPTTNYTLSDPPAAAAVAADGSAAVVTPH
jgi:hypothetical protein